MSMPFSHLCLLTSTIEVKFYPPTVTWRQGPYPSWWLHFERMAFKSLKKRPLGCRRSAHISKGQACLFLLIRALRQGGVGRRGLASGVRRTNGQFFRQLWAFPDRNSRGAGSSQRQRLWLLEALLEFGQGGTFCHNSPTCDMVAPSVRGQTNQAEVQCQILCPSAGCSPCSGKVTQHRS